MSAFLASPAVSMPRHWIAVVTTTGCVVVYEVNRGSANVLIGSFACEQHAWRWHHQAQAALGCRIYMDVQWR